MNIQQSALFIITTLSLYRALVIVNKRNTTVINTHVLFATRAAQDRQTIQVRPTAKLTIESLSEVVYEKPIGTKMSE